jgi:sec-independent protein translocase protein TatA
MGPLGMPEMMFIMVLALVLFGPKKLPEIGRTVGKAINEFRRASSELKTTFEREMQTLEQETNSIKEIAAPYQYDAYNYDYSESGNTTSDGSYGTESYDSTAVVPSTPSASATEGAESPVAPEGSIARGAEISHVSEPVESTHPASAAPADYQDALQPNPHAFQPAADPHSAVSTTSEPTT